MTPAEVLAVITDLNDTAAWHDFHEDAKTADICWRAVECIQQLHADVVTVKRHWDEALAACDWIGAA
jgi:hypothetical protein